MDEFERIDQLLAPLAAGEPGAFGLANDAAVIAPAPGHELVLTKDMMAEGVHFLADDPAGLVARKLLRVNLSDLAAMGARPRGYLLGLGLDADRGDDWVAAFIGGLAADQEEYGLTLLGGDTIVTRNGVLTLSLTAVGEVASGRALTRSGARPGDLVAVTGTIGDAALGLLVRRGELDRLDAGDSDDLVGRYRLPQPRSGLGPRLIGLASAALDVSDGLLGDAGHIARRSGVAISLCWPDVPLSAAARRAVARQPDLAVDIVTGGDDYELLFTLDPEDWATVEAAAAASATPVTVIGRCDEGCGVALDDGAGRNMTPRRTGWRHGTPA